MQAPDHLFVADGMIKIVQALPELLGDMVLDAAGILPGAGDDIQHRVAVLLIGDHVLQDGPGMMGDGGGPFFVQVGEDLQDGFPGEFLDVILGGSIIDPQHAKDAIGPLHITAHPI
jgi:hypothetical protein